MTEDDRMLLNWLSTRVTPRGQIAPGHEDERNAILAAAKECKARGLAFKPGVYTPRTAVDTPLPDADQHQVHCPKCRIAYRDTQYHCCICRRVFRSAGAFEKHQSFANGETRGDQVLLDAGMVKREDGVWIISQMEADYVARLNAIRPRPTAGSSGAA